MSFEIARRHRFHREISELPDGVRAHVLPSAVTAAADTPRAYRDTSAVAERVEAAYQASRAFLAER